MAGEKAPKRGGSSNAGAAGVNKEQAPNEKLEAFRNMTDDEFVSYLEFLNRDDTVEMTPDFYSGSSFQKMVYDLGVNDKPTVLSDEDFENFVAQNGYDANYELPKYDSKFDLSKVVFYRGVTSSRSISAEEIQDQIKFSDGFHVGGGVHGDGLYFARDASTAAKYAHNFMYGDGRVSKMVLKPGTKAITLKELRALYGQLPTKVQTALESAGDKSSWGNKGESQLALKLGYDVMLNTASSHAIVLNRSCMIMSEKTYSQNEAFNLGL